VKKKLSQIASGLGVGGAPRMGHPKSNAERRTTHKARFGTSKLPPRGTGVRRQMQQEKSASGGYVH
jgi:hypothetical protein